MASPFLASLCCMVNQTDILPQSTMPHHITKQGVFSYNVLCTVSSVLGILGAAYQLWPKTPLSQPRGEKEINAFLRQNANVCSLAIADLLASFGGVMSMCVEYAGVFIRSVVWLADRKHFDSAGVTGPHESAHIFCAISSAWVQYFYITTYFWTFFCALDTYLLTKNKPSYRGVYHAISWLLSAVVCGVGLLFLYQFSLFNCSHVTSHLLPHYLSTYVPILIVFTVNPVLYYKSSQAVKESLTCRGYFTDRERRILASIKEKFFLMMLVFYICWSLNIVNGVLLLLRHHISYVVFVILWQFTAVVNPIQAFLNCLVYHSVGCSYNRLINRQSSQSNRDFSPRTQIQASIGSDSMSEISPLLNFRR